MRGSCCLVIQWYKLTSVYFNLQQCTPIHEVARYDLHPLWATTEWLMPVEGGYEQYIRYHTRRSILDPLQSRTRSRLKAQVNPKRFWEATVRCEEIPWQHYRSCKKRPLLQSEHRQAGAAENPVFISSWNLRAVAKRNDYLIHFSSFYSG